jgi:predicted permease
MRTLLYVVLSILAALGATFAYGFLCALLGVFFPGIRNSGGGAIVFYSTLALGLIYSQSRLRREAQAKAGEASKEAERSSE